MKKSETLSFNTPIVEDEDFTKLYAKPTIKRRFIIKTVFIDKYSKKASRIELTPSVCDTCAFDVAAKDFGSWHKVPDDQKEIIKRALEVHKKEVHTLAEQRIVDEDQLPTKWLGAKGGV